MKLKEKEGVVMTREAVKDDVWVPTVCKMCNSSCGIRVHRVNGVMVKIEGNPDSPNTIEGKICAKGASGLQQVYSPTRVKVPLKRTNPEKGIGVDPKWVEISWEEALDTTAQKLKKIREDDPRKLMLLTFESTMHSSGLRPAFQRAFGELTLLKGGADYWCGNGGHATAFLTNGDFSSNPTLKYCNYLLLIGVQTGFGLDHNPSVKATELAEARERGLKLVVVDPVMSAAASRADEWLPIRPGTDAAFALAVVNTLVNELGIYDAEFLKKYTNGPYLIGPDGHYLRDKATNKPLIWDAAAEKAKTYDDPAIKDFALEGSYQVNGTGGQPAFQVLKEHVKKYTCEMAAEVTTIPARTIRRIAREFGEAASIGSTIMLEGKTLPLRPACVHSYKGPSGHKHAILTGFSLQLMNMIVGSIDVPGGRSGYQPLKLPSDVHSDSWAPEESPDGMLVAGSPHSTNTSFPARPVTRPQTLNLDELFPVAIFTEAISQLVIANPEKFHIPYKVEAIIHYHSNMIFSTTNPEAIAEWLKKVPFQLSLAFEIDETTEFADIILPTTTYLESLDMFPNRGSEWQEPDTGQWYYLLRQPVVAPPPGVRHGLAIFLEIAERLGIRRELYQEYNTLEGLREPYKLDPDKKYSWEEFSDIVLKSKFGPEYDLAWFKKHGVRKWPRKVEEIYMRPFIKPRIPIYLEHFLEAGKEVKRVADESGFTWWDVSDYQALLDWKPCPAYEHKSPEYDLYLVNFRLNFHTFGVTGYTTWLDELTEYTRGYDIRLNSRTAKKKGIKDGDLVWIEPEGGDGIKVKGKVKITEGIHPEVVGIPGHFGHWAARLPCGQGKGVHVNTLYIANLERLDFVSGALDTCVKLKISKVG